MKSEERSASYFDDGVDDGIDDGDGWSGSWNWYRNRDPICSHHGKLFQVVIVRVGVVVVAAVQSSPSPL